MGSSETIRETIIMWYDIVQSNRKLFGLTLSLLSSTARNKFVINSLLFSRCYSNSTNHHNNLKTKGVCISNPLDSDKDIIIYNDVDSLKKEILEENKGKSGIYKIRFLVLA